VRIQEAIRSIENKLGDSGRVLVRPSGTEPLIRVMAEGPKETELKQYVDYIADVIKQELLYSLV
jgi:phosphoglucosamine mutase